MKRTNQFQTTQNNYPSKTSTILQNTYYEDQNCRAPTNEYRETYYNHNTNETNNRLDQDPDETMDQYDACPSPLYSKARQQAKWQDDSRPEKLEKNLSRLRYGGESVKKNIVPGYVREKMYQNSYEGEYYEEENEEDSHLESRHALYPERSSGGFTKKISESDESDHYPTYDEIRVRHDVSEQMNKLKNIQKDLKKPTQNPYAVYITNPKKPENSARCGLNQPEKHSEISEKYYDKCERYDHEKLKKFVRDPQRYTERLERDDDKLERYVENSEYMENPEKCGQYSSEYGKKSHEYWKHPVPVQPSQHTRYSQKEYYEGQSDQYIKSDDSRQNLHEESDPDFEEFSQTSDQEVDDEIDSDNQVDDDFQHEQSSENIYRFECQGANTSYRNSKSDLSKKKHFEEYQKTRESAGKTQVIKTRSSRKSAILPQKSRRNATNSRSPSFEDSNHTPSQLSQNNPQNLPYKPSDPRNYNTPQFNFQANHQFPMNSPPISIALGSHANFTPGMPMYAIYPQTPMISNQSCIDPNYYNYYQANMSLMQSYMQTPNHFQPNFPMMNNFLPFQQSVQGLPMSHLQQIPSGTNFNSANRFPNQYNQNYFQGIGYNDNSTNLMSVMTPRENIENNKIVTPKNRKVSYTDISSDVNGSNDQQPKQAANFNPDKYLQEQEDFLRKLENDKMKFKEKTKLSEKTTEVAVSSRTKIDAKSNDTKISTSAPSFDQIPKDINSAYPKNQEEKILRNNNKMLNNSSNDGKPMQTAEINFSSKNELLFQIKGAENGSVCQIQANPNESKTTKSNKRNNDQVCENSEESTAPHSPHIGLQDQPESQRPVDFQKKQALSFEDMPIGMANKMKGKKLVMNFDLTGNNNLDDHYQSNIKINEKRDKTPVKLVIDMTSPNLGGLSHAGGFAKKNGTPTPKSRRINDDGQSKPLKKAHDTFGAVANTHAEPSLPRSKTQIVNLTTNSHVEKINLNKDQLAGILVFDEEKDSKNKSLAEVFMQRKKDLMTKMECQRQTSQTRPTNEKENSDANFTKEELLKRRKEYKGPQAPKKVQVDHVDHTNSNMVRTPKGRGTIHSEDDRKREKSKEPHGHLLERLAMGQKTKVSKKDMIALTNKMYENLPEIKKKKEEERKKGDLKKRMEKVKELDQKLRGKNK